MEDERYKALVENFGELVAIDLKLLDNLVQRLGHIPLLSVLAEDVRYLQRFVSALADDLEGGYRS